MNRNESESFIKETYNAVANYPWLKYPNMKCFATAAYDKDIYNEFLNDGRLLKKG